MSSHPIIVHPFAIPIHVGRFQMELSGFGIAVLLAFLIAQVVSERELLRRGQEFEARHVGDVLLAAIVGTIVGGKIYYVAIITHNWHDLFSRAGFVFWGGFIGAVIACWATIRFRKLPFLRYADVAGIAIAAGYAVGRTGCWAVGDDYGKWYDGPLAVAFPQGIPPSTVGSMTHAFHAVFPPTMDPSTLVGVVPTQLIEVALGFVMFAVLWRLRRHTHADGWLFGVYAVLAGIERFAVEFLRIKDDRFFALSVAQCIAVAVFIAGIVIMRVRTGPTGRPSASKMPTLMLAVTVGCASLGRGAAQPANVCQPQQCYLDVQNDNGVIIAVRYYDSTGVGDVLGSVGAGSVRRFALLRRTSRNVTVEVSREGRVYRAQAKLSLPPLENVIHFPTDFDTTPTR